MNSRFRSRGYFKVKLHQKSVIFQIKGLVKTLEMIQHRLAVSFRYYVDDCLFEGCSGGNKEMKMVDLVTTTKGAITIEGTLDLYSYNII